jgi:hypothetical protein
VVQHHSNEGDFDLPAMGSCCNEDHQQGPHTFVNEESIESENIVIWYVPAMPKDGVAPGPIAAGPFPASQIPKPTPALAGRCLYRPTAANEQL